MSHRAESHDEGMGVERFCMSRFARDEEAAPIQTSVKRFAYILAKMSATFSPHRCVDEDRERWTMLLSHRAIFPSEQGSAKKKTLQNGPESIFWGG